MSNLKETLDLMRQSVSRTTETTVVKEADLTKNEKLRK